MVIKKKPFRKYNVDSTKVNVITIKINEEERKNLDEWKHLIQQEKDSTALKQLAYIGAEVLLDKKMKAINEVILGNYRKNKRLGIVTFD